MMKNINKFFWVIAVLFTVMTVSSCKKDLTTFDTNKIEGYTIEKADDEILDVLQFENLVVEPKVISSDLDAEYIYTWKVTALTNDTTTLLLAHTKNLNERISNVPNVSGKYYKLIYEIEDKKNDLKFIYAWDLNVRNSLGEGLVVADSKDGQNTDLSLIMAPLVSKGITSETVRYNIYSSANGATIPGIMKQLLFYKDMAHVFGFTENGIYKVKTLDYTLTGKNQDLYTNPKSTFQPVKMGLLNQGFYVIEDNTLSANYLAINFKFGLAFDEPTFKIPNHVSVNGAANVGAYLSFYDENRGAFAYQRIIASYGDRKMYTVPSYSGGAFNPASVSNKVNLAAGLGPNNDLLHLLKDKTSGNISLYVLNAPYNDDDNVFHVATPKSLFDLSSAPGIGQAKDFVLYDDQRVMYYASGQSVYAVLYSTNNAEVQMRYEVPAGETITTLQIFQETDYPMTAPAANSNNNKQLILTTYNGTEGKVYILPLKDIGLGNIDLPKVKTYGGFGKISAITHQK